VEDTLKRQVNKMKEQIAEAAVEKLEDQGILYEMAERVLEMVDVDEASEHLVHRLKDAVGGYDYNRPRTVLDSVTEHVINSVNIVDTLAEGAEDFIQDVVSDKITDIIQENL